MSHSVLIQGPLNFYLFSFLRAPFVLSSQVHFFFDHQGNGAFFSELEKDKLCQSGIVDLIVAKWRRSSVSNVLCVVNYLFIYLMLNVPLSPL